MVVVSLVNKYANHQLKILFFIKPTCCESSPSGLEQEGVLGGSQVCPRSSELG